MTPLSFSQLAAVFFFAAIDGASNNGLAAAANVRGSTASETSSDPLQTKTTARRQMESIYKNENGGEPYDSRTTNGIGVATVGKITVIKNNGGSTTFTPAPATTPAPAPANNGGSAAGNGNLNVIVNGNGNADGASEQNEEVQEQTPPQENNGSLNNLDSGSCPNQVYTDVVIIGAGMAGVSAAATLEAAGVEYVVLESTDRIGGRVRSHSFGVPGNTWTVEDGANWILDFNNNPIMEMVDTHAFNAPPQDYFDYIIYDESVCTFFLFLVWRQSCHAMPSFCFHLLLTAFLNYKYNFYSFLQGNLMEPSVYQAEEERFQQAWTGAIADADNQWTRNHARFNDIGAKGLLANNGWTVGDGQIGDLDYTIQWETLDWEYAEGDTSVRYFPPFQLDPYFVADPRGFEYLPQQHFATNADPDRLVTSARVRKVSYDENISNGDGKLYKAVVTVNSEPTTTSCTEYIAQRVISTVSNGVINNSLINFSPPLTYGTNTNPYEMAQYIKIFYQFDNKFWDDNEFIRVLRDSEHRGECHQWQNLDPQMPGSNVIRCEIMTEAFENLIDPDTLELSQDTLLSLLDPLRLVYGSEAVGTPIDIYTTGLNKDADFGFGAYANWKKGYTFDDFARFFGIQQLTGYCRHNGCNAQGDWILHFSGAAVCYEHAETVAGAYMSGERSANYVLRELGFNVNADNSPCDASWVYLQ